MNSLERTNKLKKLAHSLIPAGAHTYSRADNQFPSCTPSFVSKAMGWKFWDENNHEYIDYSMGLLSVSVGHANETINNKVIETLKNGTSYARPSLFEGQLAEKINSIIPSAEMVKFAKNGSDVTSAAIRLARNYTGRKYIVRCNQQPFLSFNDWFIASTSISGGIPVEMKDWILRFNYNDIKSLESIFNSFGNDIACVIMEPFTNELPQSGFLEAVKEICEKNGSILVFDEMITGFRVDLGGAQSLYKVIPHLSTFGKEIANGYALSVLCEKKELMQQGNMNNDVFLLSCTYGGETVGLAAGLATIDFMEEKDTIQSIIAYGLKLQKLFNHYITINGLNDNIKIGGHPARLDMKFQEGHEISYALKTLFMQEMMLQGIFMESIGIFYSHDDEAFNKTDYALEKSLKTVALDINTNTIFERITGKIIEPVFTK